MEAVQSKIDSLTTYKIVGNHITVERDGELAKFKINNEEMINRFKEDIQVEIKEVIDKEKGNNCEICGNRYITISHKSKYCCDKCKQVARERTSKAWYAEKGKEKAREYYHKQKSSTIKKPKKKKHISQLTKLNREAREQGMTYGQLQAQRYIESMKEY